MIVHIDFESRSAVDIWEVGAWEYSVHPSTEIQCLCYAVDGGPVVLISKEDVGNPKNLMTALEVLANNYEVQFRAHNAYFEQVMWQNIMVKRYGFPEIPTHRWVCTAAKARAMGLPGKLEKAAAAIRLPFQKDIKGKQIMLKMCKPRKPKKGESKDELLWHEDPEEYQILYEYCKQDVEVERALDHKLPDLIPQEQRVWEIDQLINMRGLCVDIPAAKTMVELVNWKKYQYNEELSKITGGKVTAGTQRDSMLTYLKEVGVNLPDLTKDTVHKAISSGTLSGVPLRVLQLRSEVAKSSVKKYERMVEAGQSDGKLRDILNYHGASTGRWSGQLVQLQNLPRGTIKDTDSAIDIITQHGWPHCEMVYPKLMETISSCIRGMLIPRPGHDMLVVDYAAIEARVVMWLANCGLGLEEFETNDRGEDVDIYVKMARRIYNDNTLTKSNKSHRQLGKQAILGCGYGMGGPKFRGTCAGYGMDISEYDGQRIVNLYRETYPAIKNFWNACNQATIDAVRDPAHSHPVGQISFWYDKASDFLFCYLPSGRRLAYYEPRIGPNRFDQPGISYMNEINSQWVRKESYGGLLVENATQAVARDLMAYSFAELERQGYPILMHTHDEIVCEVPEGQQDINEMINIMCKEPKWAAGLPIKAEGFRTKRYKKE